MQQHVMFWGGRKRTGKYDAECVLDQQIDDFKK